jgi:STE24 endopeptidase
VHGQEADIFAHNAARAPDSFARIAMKLSQYRKIEPGPREGVIIFDHPGGHSRVKTAMRWKAEHPGEPDVRWRLPRGLRYSQGHAPACPRPRL